MCVCQRQTCQGMHPWYQAWLFRFVPLSLSSSSSCFLSFSDGASNQNFSLENLKDMTGARWETPSPCTNTGRQQHEFKPLCDLCWLKVKSQQSLLSSAFSFLKKNRNQIGFLKKWLKYKHVANLQPSLLFLCECLLTEDRVGWGRRNREREDWQLWHSHTGIHSGGTRGPKPRPMLEFWPCHCGNVIVRWGSSLSGLCLSCLYAKKKKKKKLLYTKIYVKDKLGILGVWTHTQTHSSAL